MILSFWRCCCVEYWWCNQYYLSTHSQNMWYAVSGFSLQSAYVVIFVAYFAPGVPLDGSDLSEAQYHERRVYTRSPAFFLERSCLSIYSRPIKSVRLSLSGLVRLPSYCLWWSNDHAPTLVLVCLVRESSFTRAWHILLLGRTLLIHPKTSKPI